MATRYAGGHETPLNQLRPSLINGFLFVRICLVGNREIIQSGQCFFYTAIIINPVDVAENIKRSGGYIPGVRPGKTTADYIDKVLSRLTLIGSVYIALVCVLPVILSTRMNVPFYFGGTALLIVVGVSLDTVGQIDAHMVSRHYEGFVKGAGRVRGRLG